MFYDETTQDFANGFEGKDKVWIEKRLEILGDIN